MEQIIAQLPVLAKVIPYLVAFNLILVGVSKALEVLAIKVPVLSVIAGYAQKLVDAIGYNPKH